MLYFQCTKFYFVDKYLLSYSALINPLELDVHHMMSQIVSIWLIFTQTYAPFFIIFPVFISSYLWNEKTVKGNVPDFSKLSDRTTKIFMSFALQPLWLMSTESFLAIWLSQYKFLIKEFQITKVYLRLFSLTVMNPTYRFCLMSNAKT